MSILRAIDRAYDVLIQRNWDTIYWCVDLHGTVLESSYDSGEIHFISQEIADTLAYISGLPETCLILWSSITAADELKIRKLFADKGIKVDFVNENPLIDNTITGNFDRKFYFSILVDDKAGFCPSEWPAVTERVNFNRLRVTDEHEA